MLLIFEKLYSPGKSTRLFSENPFLFATKYIFEDQTFFRKQKTSYYFKKKIKKFLTFLQKGKKKTTISQLSRNTHQVQSVLNQFRTILGQT